MNKAELVDALETRLGGRKQATAAVEAVVELITLTVAKGDKVAISGFGTFEKQARNARTGRNPRTGEAVKIKKTAVPRFRPGTAFKEVVSDTKALRAYTASLKEKNAPAAAAAPTRPATAGTTTRTATTRKTATAAPVRKAAAKTTTAAPRRAAAAPAKKAAATPTARRTAKKA